MGLWRVDVGGVSHRFVPADTRREAEAAVASALLSSFDIRATPADPALSRAYEVSGPTRRRNMLARLDGLTNPRERQSAKSARRRLARQIRFDTQHREWLRAEAEASPPLSPEAVERLIQMQEIRHVEKNFDRLPEWDRHSPVHGE